MTRKASDENTILPEIGPTGGMKAWAAKLLQDDVPHQNKEEQDITMVAIMAKRDGGAGPIDIIPIFVIIASPNRNAEFAFNPREKCLRHLVAPGHLRSSG